MSDSTEDSATPDESSRRDLISKSAVVAAVAAVAGIAVAKSASAANGDTINVGGTETGTSTTSLSGGSSFVVTDGSSSASGAAIRGRQTSGSSGSIGVLGEYDTAVTGGIGVKGATSTNSSIGVYGESTGSSSGTGVYGYSSGGVGVVGSGGDADFQGAGNGVFWVSAAGLSNPPGGGSVGMIGRDSTGNLWYCHTTGLWRRLGGPAAAGAFHAITPKRVYDSRAAAPIPGLLAGGVSRTISVADGRDITGAVNAANVVPAGATAVAANVTVTSTTGSFGFLCINPGGSSAQDTSVINWFGAGQNLANGLTLTLNAIRQLTVVCGTGGGSTHFIVDVSGYFL